MRHALARDSNEAEIVAALRAVGAFVYKLHTPCDLLVGYRGVTYLLEVKRPLGPRGGKRGGTLTPAQKDFNLQWKGAPVQIVRSATEALRAIGAISS